MNIRIATWNMNYWQRSAEQRTAAWRYLEQEVKPDVALVQEAVPQDEHPAVAYRPIKPGNRGWGSAVVCYGDSRAEAMPLVPLGWPVVKGELPASHPGACAVARLHLEDGKSILLVSLYGLMEKGGGGVPYATTSVHRMLSDLTPLLDPAVRKEQVILGGDLNCSTQLKVPYREAHKALFARIRAFGLVDCLEQVRDTRPPLADCFCDEAPNCGHVRTQRHQNKPDSRPWQTDYLFVSPELAEGLKACEAWDREDAWQLSDHCPVVADFDFGLSKPVSGT